MGPDCERRQKILNYLAILWQISCVCHETLWLRPVRRGVEAAMALGVWALLATCREMGQLVLNSEAEVGITRAIASDVAKGGVFEVESGILQLDVELVFRTVVRPLGHANHVAPHF